MSLVTRRQALRAIGVTGALWAGIGAGQAARHGRGVTQNPDDLRVIPRPDETAPTRATYGITDETTITYDDPAAFGPARLLAHLLRPATGFDLPVDLTSGGGSNDEVSLRLSGGSPVLGPEGYRLQVTDSGVAIRANEPAGLFMGVQTLRQLLPAKIEHDTTQPRPWPVPGVRIRDSPRFAYRGVHLDVARHFFDIKTVKRYIDYLALYKINHFHVHLTDDQGWRLVIESWPRLAEVGGSTEVGGGDGGYYTQDEYAEIVQYARDRAITVVPEIDMPGHTNAALASYAELNCDGQPTDLYTGTDVGFSSLCVDREVTYEFVDDVLREVAALTPGPYIHIGGDEAEQLSDEEYATFMRRAIPIVQQYGKQPIGWYQVLGMDPPESTVAQYWNPSREAPEVASATQAGHEVIMSPGHPAFLDIKYNAGTELGLSWPGSTSVRDAYTWDPGTFIEGVDESSVKGPEAPLWTETIDTLDDIEFMLFPRMPAHAEVGWTAADETEWASFRERLAAHGPRWEILGVDFYRSPDVPWVPRRSRRPP